VARERRDVVTQHNMLVSVVVVGCTKCAPTGISTCEGKQTKTKTKPTTGGGGMRRKNIAQSTYHALNARCGIMLLVHAVQQLVQQLHCRFAGGLCARGGRGSCVWSCTTAAGAFHGSVLLLLLLLLLLLQLRRHRSAPAALCGHLAQGHDLGLVGGLRGFTHVFRSANRGRLQVTPTGCGSGTAALLRGSLSGVQRLLRRLLCLRLTMLLRSAILSSLVPLWLHLGITCTFHT